MHCAALSQGKEDVPSGSSQYRATLDRISCIVRFTFQRLVDVLRLPHLFIVRSSRNTLNVVHVGTITKTKPTLILSIERRKKLKHPQITVVLSVLCLPPYEEYVVVNRSHRR